MKPYNWEEIIYIKNIWSYTLLQGIVIISYLKSYIWAEII